jgi:hypothetical protein
VLAIIPIQIVVYIDANAIQKLLARVESKLGAPQRALAQTRFARLSGVFSIDFSDRYLPGSSPRSGSGNLKAGSFSPYKISIYIPFIG